MMVGVVALDKTVVAVPPLVLVILALFRSRFSYPEQGMAQRGRLPLYRRGDPARIRGRAVFDEGSMRYRIRTTKLFACTALGASAIALAATAAEMQPVVPLDNKSVIVGGISGDGSVIVGTLNPALALERSGFVWTQAGGMRLIGSATLGTTVTQRFTATGVSNDGSVIVGQASPDMLGGGALARGYIWTAADGFVDLGHLGGLPTSDALGVSGDGRTVVGSSFNAAGEYRGFRWQAGNMEDIGAFSAGYPQMAANYDGSVIVGNTLTQMQVSNPFNSTVITMNVSAASVWTEATGQLEQLPMLSGGTQSVARDVSDDGRVIVGQAHNGASGKMHAVRWLDRSPQDLTTPGSGLGDNYSFALGVSGNGHVVVGEAQLDNMAVQRGFRWTEGGGMQTVEDWLRASGAIIVSDITYAARATNCDGSVVVGETGLSTTGNQMFIARGNGTGPANCAGSASTGLNGGGGQTGGTQPGGGETGGEQTGGEQTDGGQTGGGQSGGGVGLIIVDEFNATLADAGAVNVALLGNVNLLLNGAGSRPLDRRVDSGRSIAWIGGDWGRTDSAGNNGDIGLGEIGFGHNLGGVQINAIGGFTRFEQAMTLGGRTELSAGYVKAEALSQLYATDKGGLWGALTASAMWGNADITRNYLNGGAIDASYGSTDSTGYGVRGRLQWENAVDHVSPYADLSYSRGCFDAYRETGGGFPAAFDRLCDNSTELRYGFDVSYPIHEGFRLIGTLEGVHRFEERSANVKGQAIGLYAFDIGGAAYQQDWLRVGAGFEADIGASTLSIIGNATTQSNGPKAWVAANWRVTF